MLLVRFVSIGVIIFIFIVIYIDLRFVVRKYLFFLILLIVDVIKNDGGKIICVVEGINIIISLEGMFFMSFVVF